MQRQRNHLVYLIGEPGAGKTTTMTALTGGTAGWTEDGMPFAHQTRGTVALLGKARAAFGGTDTLGMSVARTAEAWIATRPHEWVLGEGDRLAYGRFFDVAASAGYELHLIYLACPPGVAEQRRAARAAEHGLKPQNPSWVRGRASKATRLARAYGAHLIGAAHCTAAQADAIRELVPGLAEALADEGVVPDAQPG